MAQRRRRERIARQPWQKAEPQDYAQQRSFRLLNHMAAKYLGWWAQCSLRWGDVKWGLVAAADEARESFGVEVRMRMLPAEEAREVGFVSGYVVQAQIGDPPTAMTMVWHFALNHEAPEPEAGDAPAPMAYYHCEPGGA